MGFLQEGRGPVALSLSFRCTSFSLNLTRKPPSPAPLIELVCYFQALHSHLVQKLPHIIPDIVGKMDKMLSISPIYAHFDVNESKEVRMNCLRSVAELFKFENDVADVLNCVRAEKNNCPLLMGLSHRNGKFGERPSAYERKHQANDYSPEELAG